LDGTIGNLQTGANYIASENYLGVGRAVGFSSMMILVLMSVSPSLWVRLQLALLLVLYSFVLLTAGGRGPVLAVLAGVLVLVLGSFRMKGGTVRVQLVASIATLVVVCAMMAIWAGPESRTFHRFTVLASQEAGGTSAGERLHNWESALDIISRAPVVGQGIGGWPIAMRRIDVRGYPHNIIIETLTEGGVIGFLLLGTAMLFGLRSLCSRNVYDDNRGLLVYLLFVNTLINAQVSGDLSDNRLLFATIGLMVISGMRAGRFRASQPISDLPPRSQEASI
jgi:O-antigen ligase